MGASSSKIEDSKALLLCRERKRFVRQALDGRCSLAVAHVLYIQSLKNTGIALRKFIEPEACTESSLYTSTSATPEPLALTDKSTSQLSNSSPSISQHAERVESFSPVPSPPYPGRFHVNNMKAGRTSSTTIQERLPIPVTATLHTVSSTPKVSAPHNEILPSETPPPPGTPPWDYFGLFHPIDNHISYQDGRGLHHGLDNMDDIRRLREEEGIPELEEEGDNASSNGKDGFTDSDDDFDQSSTEPLVQVFKNRNEVVDSKPVNISPTVPSVQSFASETEKQNRDIPLLSNGSFDTEVATEMTPSKAPPSVVTLAINGKDKGIRSENKLEVKDLVSCIKEIEDLFLKASESGKEVPIMLEADEMNFHPLLAEEKANYAKASMFLTNCFGCCSEEAHLPEEPVPNDMKYLTWHRSASSLSSSSRIPLGATSIDDTSGDLFGSICMNSGSHASTLDRLYAWERKLYDEVKVSGIIQKEYDIKCKVLRNLESRGEIPYKIDKTRAAIKDLHWRIRLAIQRIDSISKKIEELRDKELQPQLEELIGGLTRMWARMLDCHKHQYAVVSVARSSDSIRVFMHSESRQQGTILLEFELNGLCSNFTKWISAHRTYLQAINGWLMKCVLILKHKASRRSKNVEFSPQRYGAPPIFVTCRDWLALLDKLPAKEVADAIRDLVAVISSFLPRPEKGHGNSNISFSLPRKADRSDVIGEVSQRHEAQDWGRKFDSVQSCLVVLLDRLTTFAEISVEKYRALQEGINAARDAYEKV